MLVLQYFIILTISFLFTILAGSIAIPLLKKLKASQTEREELIEHKKKEGTPTMGGVIFIIPIVVTYMVFSFGNYQWISVLLLSLGFGIIGFIDDYLKVVKKRPDGFKAKAKFLLQLLLCILFIIWVYYFNFDMSIIVPFASNPVKLGFFEIPFFIFVIMGTVNGVNFTDGLDGLATSVTLVVAVFFVNAALFLSGLIPPNYLNLMIPVIGALIGFLVYNKYPARVFMGDTGSLFLGGYVAAVSIMLRIPLFILIFGIIYLTEVLSVIIQVLYFKKTKGKRVFRMAPIHHHFELGGMEEKKIVMVFSCITFLAATVSFLIIGGVL